jgi:hypothetical protein
MEPAQIQEIHSRHWKVGYGSIAPDEVLYVQDLIRQHRPQAFIEIGMASGLSGGLISLLLEENGGERFVTLDHNNTFFGDKTKENGFLLEEIYPAGEVKVEKLPFHTAVDIPRLGQRFQMAFVDANHQHPWPLIDTLCLYPFLDGPRIVLHHDLNLYRLQRDKIYGIGPKYLHDQFPESHRDVSTANSGNIFSVSLDLPQEQMEKIAIDAFALPWSLRTPLRGESLEAFRTVLVEHYSEGLLAAFEDCLDKFNRSL